MRRIIRKKPPAEDWKPRVARWCDRHGYSIDIEACRARARKDRRCRRCHNLWRQIPLPF